MWKTIIVRLNWPDPKLTHCLLYPEDQHAMEADLELFLFTVMYLQRGPTKCLLFVNNRNAIHASVGVIEISTGIYTLPRKTVIVYSSHWYSLQIMLINAAVSLDSVLTQFSVTLTESCVLRKRKGTINLSGHKTFYLNPMVTNVVDFSERASLPSFRMPLNLEDLTGYTLLQGRF